MPGPLNVGQTVTTRVPTLRFDPPIPAGVYEYSLVVVDVLDVASREVRIQVTVRSA
jgi:hypothetical protein